MGGTYLVLQRGRKSRLANFTVGVFLLLSLQVVASDASFRGTTSQLSRPGVHSSKENTSISATLELSASLRQIDGPTDLRISQLLPAPSISSRDEEIERDSGVGTKPVDDVNLRSFETNTEVKETGILLIRPAGVPDNKPVCRLQGVCRAGDGSFLLPTWMKEYADEINKCGLQGNAFYVLETTKKGTVEIDLSDGNMQAKRKVWTIKDIPRPAMTLSEKYSDHDMIGTKAPRELIHWLVTDMIPPLFMLDMSTRFDRYKSDGKVSGISCVVEKSGEASKCDEEKMFTSVQPLVLVDVRVSSYKSHQWPQGFMRLVRNSLSGNVRVVDANDVYGWKLRSQASCFRSVISTSLRAEEIPSNSFSSSHSMWESNGLTRESVRSLPRPDQKARTPCVIKTLILNKYGKRYMVGHDKLRVAIEKVARKEIQPRYPSVRLLSETVFFENSSFHEQVSVMQETNIVVSAHGSSNANIVFLRPDTSIIEIMPFALHVDTYSTLAKTFGVNYKTIMAQPDDEVFRSCVKHFNPSMPPGILRQLLLWEQNAKAFREATIASHSNPTTDFQVAESPDERSETHLRLCTTYQRLSFNVDHVAKIVAKEALAQCGLVGL